MQYSNSRLIRLILPIILEQFLIMLVGMVDSVMVSGCGEEAISAVSLITSLNNLAVMILTALATGGSIVIAQSLGRGDREEVSASSGQLMLLITLVGTAVGAVCMIFHAVILRALYPSIDDTVMSNCRTYFWYSAMSYPFLAAYNGGTGIFRSVSDTKTALYVSFLSNVLNVIGNALLIYVFHMGVKGAAVSTLFSRMAAAAALLYLLSHRKEIGCRFTVKPDAARMKRILGFAVPGCLENSVSQGGKILLSSLTASFGTIAVTADAVTCSVGEFQMIPSSAIGIAMTTVIGQLYGAGDIKGVRSYTRKLMLMSHAALLILGIPLFFLEGGLFSLYHLSEGTASLAKLLLTYNIACAVLLHPESFALPGSLRAMGDVKYPMFVSIGTLWTVRISSAYFLGRYMGLGVFGVWIAMTLDWVFRAAFFLPRFKKLTNIQK